MSVDFTAVPISDEMVTVLSGDWSEPVELKIESGQLILRNVESCACEDCRK